MRVAQNIGIAAAQSEAYPVRCLGTVRGSVPAQRRLNLSVSIN